MSGENFYLAGSRGLAGLRAGPGSRQEREIELAARRIGEIEQDIARLVPTTDDAFAMTVNGTSFAERKTAGRALMQEMLTLVQFQHQGEQVIASIGGFDLLFEVQRLGREG